MSFRLFEDRIAIIADEEDDKTEGGIILVSDNAKEHMRYGTVAVVGVGHRSDHDGEIIPIDVKTGDRVFWNRNSGSPITIEGQEYIFLASREVVGVIE